MPKLYIFRGLPGSGKSTKAKAIGCFHIEADSYHVKNGVYDWKAENQSKAHQFCTNMVTQAMVHGVDVAVSNTHTMGWEFKKYIELAKTYGYDVQVIRCTGEYGNTHGVPEESLAKMKARFEDYEGEIIC